MKGSRHVRLREAWIILFLLGIIMLNYPFIHIFNKIDTILGFPVLFLYFMLGWPASILIVYRFSQNMHEEPPEGESEGKPGS